MLSFRCFRYSAAFFLLFRRYSIADAEVVNDTQAEFIANFGGCHIMAIATVREATPDGHIVNLTVRPK